MPKIARYILTVFLVQLSIGLAQGQDAPIKWGEVSQEELEMTSFAADTNASAVILCDFGTAHYSKEIELIYRRSPTDQNSQ